MHNFTTYRCAQTDVLPALSLCMEPPEHGLLLRKPRNVKKDRLADGKLLLHAYGFLGIMESLCAMTMLVFFDCTTQKYFFNTCSLRSRAFWYLQRRGVPFSSIVLKFYNTDQLADIGLTSELLYTAQSVYFFTLVLMQWG